MTETMRTLLLLLGNFLLSSTFLLLENQTVLVGCNTLNIVDNRTIHSLQLSPEDLAATRPMKRFWTSTGLCPPEPRNASGPFLLSEDSLTNLELIGSLPNRGISHVRIHWLLELLEVYEEKQQFRYNFTALDLLLDHMHNLELYPGFELMGIPKGYFELSSSESFWSDVVQQIVERYTVRYGLQYVAGWRFETWNEPDLRSYNTLNFTVNDYLSYVFAVRKGLNAMNRRFYASQLNNIFPLYGPAGLFKALEHHPFCWSALEVCNSNTTHGCPFDTITFHRKGSGRWASEVLDGGRQLLKDISNRFPNLNRFTFSNDEADPVASWSTSRPFQADIRYAAMLFSIVTQHWSAIANGDEFGRRFNFLSHDNGFLSYYPHVFDQRTLLARFQMNLTTPPHVQFIIKPVFSALGMLANLAPFASPTRYLQGNVSYVTSIDKNKTYLCIMASRSNDTYPLLEPRTYLNVSISIDIFNGTLLNYLIEAIQDGRNDPFQLWKWQGKPAFPTNEQFATMRKVQLPTVLKKGSHIVEPGKDLNMKLSLNLRAPWVASVRVCSEYYAFPARAQDVSIRTVFRDDVLIHWTFSYNATENHRCIETYEVWFKPSFTTVSATAGTAKRKCRWCIINKFEHTPFMFYQYTSNIKRRGENLDCSDPVCSGVVGYYKIRAVDLFGRKGPFSVPVQYNVNATSNRHSQN